MAQQRTTRELECSTEYRTPVLLRGVTSTPTIAALNTARRRAVGSTSNSSEEKVLCAVAMLYFALPVAVVHQYTTSL